MALKVSGFWFFNQQIIISSWNLWGSPRRLPIDTDYAGENVGGGGYGSCKNKGPLKKSYAKPQTTVTALDNWMEMKINRPL